MRLYAPSGSRPAPLFPFPRNRQMGDRGASRPRGPSWVCRADGGIPGVSQLETMGLTSESREVRSLLANSASEGDGTRGQYLRAPSSASNLRGTTSIPGSSWLPCSPPSPCENPYSSYPVPQHPPRHASRTVVLTPSVQVARGNTMAPTN